MHDAPGSAPETDAPRRSRRPHRHVATCIVLAVATLAGGLGASSATLDPAAADTPYTFVDERFDEVAFPPTGWEVTSGTWAADCDPAPPDGGCFAQATVTTDEVGLKSQLLFRPAQGIPADLIDPTLSFTSTFTPDATSAGDRVSVSQPLLPSGDLGDRHLIVDVFGGQSAGDATGVPVAHSVPLTSLTLPLVFRWDSLGDSAGSPLSTWGIANVRITGTLPATPYVLTANPVVNTTYHPVAGTPVTITLSGSSDPVGDTLGFVIVTPPTLGQVGAVTPTGATHATVVYSTPTAGCPDPEGTAGYLCTDHFTFKVTDAQGHESAPANVALDVSPGGAGSQQVAITAPGSSGYVTVSHGGQPTQAADLSGLVAVGPGAFPDQIELKVHASAGSVDLVNAGASGATFINGTSSPGLQIDMKGSAAKLNHALALFLWFPPAGTTPTATIDIFARDLGPTGSGPFGVVQQATVTINGVANNPRPVLTVPTGPLSIANTGGPLTFPAGAATGFGLVDGGATATTNDTVHLEVSSGTLALPASDTAGPSPLVTVQPLGGGASLDITGTVADLNTALLHLTFDPTGLGSSTVTLTAYATNPDDGLTSVHGSASITVIQGPFPFGTTTAGTLQNLPVTVFLCGRGPAGAVLSYTITASPQHGSLVADPSASAATSGCSQNAGSLISGYTYTPATGYVGADAFTYFVSDASTGLSSAPATVTITVTAHTAPTAYAVIAATRQDAPVDVVLCGHNPDPAPPLTFSIVGSPAFGTLADAGPPALNPCLLGNQAETFTYTPRAGTFTVDGIDTFSYVVDNGAQSAPAAGKVVVATRTPQVVAEQLDVDENGSIGFRLCSTTPNGAVTFTTVGPSHGTLDTQAATTSGPACPSGSFGTKYLRYVPTTLYSGPDALAYTATDGLYTSVQATITITVHQIEIPPTADDQAIIDIAPRPVAITLTGGSLQGSSLTYRVVRQPAHGSLTGTTPDLIYTPSIATGLDTFTYVANDGVADSPPATVVITIVTPQLSASVCLPGSPAIGLDQFPCAANLTSVADGSGGQIGLAHASGVRDDQLRLQVTITNRTAIADTVTLTGPAGAAPWSIRYATDGADVTGDMTGAGLPVTLGPVGSATASAYVTVIVFSPHAFPAPPTVDLAVRAVSGNDPSRSASIPARVMDGTSSPALTLAQADGTGRVTFPQFFKVTPPLFAQGPTGGAVIVAGITGTGDNVFRFKAEVQPGSTPGVTARYLLGTSTDVTSQVAAGTLTLQCYADFGCPPLRVVLTPGTGSGTFTTLVTQVSTIDGQSSLGFLSATLSAAVGPDLYTSLPLVGQHVYEATPATQLSPVGVQTSGTVAKRVFLHNEADVPDTFTVKATQARAPGDTGTISITATPFGGAPSVVTQPVLAGTYKITLAAGDEATLDITDSAGSAAGLAPASVVLTATSGLAPTKVDAYGVTFPTYFYRPDAVLTGADGRAIGQGVYDKGTTQTDTFNTSLSPSSVTVTFADRGTGPWPAPTRDSVVVKAPASTADFTVSYRLTTGGTSTDVTSAITGAGLELQLFANGAVPQTLVVTAASSISARAGRPGYFPITVTSTTAVPAGLSDTVVVGLYNLGASQLRFAGLPQAEPPDITQDVAGIARTAPFPSAGFANGATYGAAPDPTGQKFAYVSGYDHFGLQVAALKTTATTYRLQMVAPSTDSADLPLWERVVFGRSYFNRGQLVRPGDPLAADTGVHPKITVDGRDVTAQVLAGTYTTPSLHSGSTFDLSVAFDPGAAQRYRPLRFNLIDAATGAIEDVMVVGPSSIVQCSEDGFGQQLAKTGSAGHVQRLAFRSFDRTAGAGATECMQRLSHGWITPLPMVFSSFEDAFRDTPAGGDNPNGLWLYPQAGGVIRVDTDTLTVTSRYAKAYVDSALLGADGRPDPTTFKIINYVGDYPNLVWNTADPTNGLRVADNSVIGPSPFPLVVPGQDSWPGNTMEAARYFQVRTSTGTPVMVGQMHVNNPWFDDDVALVMPVDNGSGLVLDYAAPPDTRASLPGDDETTTGGIFWTIRKDGKVMQGGCLGLPPAFFKLLGINDTKVCKIYVQTTFGTVPSDPRVKASIEKIEFELAPVKVVVGIPTFNVRSLKGHIDLSPAGRVEEVKVDADFNVGPETPCALEAKARAAAGTAVSAAQKVADLACPPNYFTFDAVVTFQQGAFTGQPVTTTRAATTGVGIRFQGTLSLIGLVRLTSIEADISTDPFNFHFAVSPVDLQISAGISVSANITLSGNVGSNGFELGLAGSLSVMGNKIAAASGVVSTKGIGACGELAGSSMGFGEVWGQVPTFYPSGCTTDRFKVGA